MVIKSPELRRAALPFALVAAALGASACSASSVKQAGPTTEASAVAAFIDPSTFVEDATNHIFELRVKASELNIVEPGVRQGDRTVQFRLSGKRTAVGFDLGLYDPFTAGSYVTPYDVGTVKEIDPDGGTITYALDSDNSSSWTVTSSRDSVVIKEQGGKEMATRSGREITLAAAAQLLHGYEQMTVDGFNTDINLMVPGSGNVYNA